MTEDRNPGCGEPLTSVTIETRNPEKYLLIDRDTGEHWEIRDGAWERAQVVTTSSLINGQQAAKLAGVHANTIRNWADRGYLTPTVLASGVRRYDADEVKHASGKNTGGDFMQGLGVDPA